MSVWGFRGGMEAWIEGRWGVKFWVRGVGGGERALEEEGGKIGYVVALCSVSGVGEWWGESRV
jgi:hypothetical protein